MFLASSSSVAPAHSTHRLVSYAIAVLKVHSRHIVFLNFETIRYNMSMSACDFSRWWIYVVNVTDCRLIVAAPHANTGRLVAWRSLCFCSILSAVLFAPSVHQVQVWAVYSQCNLPRSGKRERASFCTRQIVFAWCIYWQPGGGASWLIVTPLICPGCPLHSLVLQMTPFSPELEG